MNTAEIALQEYLKQVGYSITKPRRLVFAALEGKEAMSMNQLVATCAVLDRATVYRTVSLFEQISVVQRVQIGWKYKLELTDRFAHHHHHLTCVRCGQITPLPEDELLENRLQTLAEQYSFLPEEHQIEIRGVCRDCQSKSI